MFAIVLSGSRGSRSLAMLLGSESVGCVEPIRARLLNIQKFVAPSHAIEQDPRSSRASFLASCVKLDATNRIAEGSCDGFGSSLSTLPIDNDAEGFIGALIFGDGRLLLDFGFFFVIVTRVVFSHFILNSRCAL